MTKREKRINKLKQDIFSDDWELVCESADELAQIGGDDVVDLLISLLDFENPGIRNRASLALRDIGDNRALPPLLKAILKRENKNYNGTMVYALGALDCSKHIKELFEILFYQSYEAQWGAITILKEQEFIVTADDMNEIKKMWKDCLEQPGKCNDFEQEQARKEIKEVVEKYSGPL